MITVQELIQRLHTFWREQGCTAHFGHDVETGAGTFNPATFFRCLGPEPYRAAYVEPSRRPQDGRYGENPNRMQLFHQFQVILKPSPLNIQELYLSSLEAIGFRLPEHDIRFVHDDWEQPSLGAWGLGWEVWRDGMEVTQFTYFQAVGGLELHPITVELALGIERLAMTVQNVDNVYDLQWDDQLTYGDIFHRGEVEWSHYNFEEADVTMWTRHFDGYEAEAKQLTDKQLPIPAYDFVMKASHAFNLLDARGVISVTERAGYIIRLRELARRVAETYLEIRKQLGYPLMGKQRGTDTPKPHEIASDHPPYDPDDKEDFVLEIGSEELPATFVPIGCQQLEQKLRKLLEREGLAFDKLTIGATPRRLTAYVSSLAKGKPAQTSERKGPPLAMVFDESGTVTKVGLGFFHSLGIEPITREAVKGHPQLEIRLLKGKEYLFARLHEPAQATADLLAAELPSLILSLDFPKRMRWGESDISYARPLHWIVAVHGDQVIPFSIGNIASGWRSSGHRQLAPGWIEIRHATHYFDLLRTHHVLVDREERRSSLVQQLQAIEQQTQTEAVSREKLLAENLDLVESPFLAMATFDAKFLELPPEVAISEMVHHQKYFPLRRADGTLTNQFVLVADNKISDDIIRGNLKVLSARLSDGTFLYQQDLKSTLDQLNEKLKQITYREKLGSMYDKAQRLVRNVEILHKLVPIGELADARRAAHYAKADLASDLVDEFPELQGIVGRTYAKAHGESDGVSLALDEHWMPRGDKGVLPTSATGILLSLADKLDNLISCFALGLIPTSSSDPYGLRRQVLGIVRILLHGKHRLSLDQALSACLEAFWQATKLPVDPDLSDTLKTFFLNRIKTVFQEDGLSKQEIEAAISTGFDDIYDAYCRVRALHDFQATDPRFTRLAEVYRRARGQLQDQHPPPFDANLLQEPAEQALAQALDQTEQTFPGIMEQHDYPKAYHEIAELQPLLAQLFDDVHILTDDPKLRGNRLALLKRVFALFEQLLDFSKLKLSM